MLKTCSCMILWLYYYFNYWYTDQMTLTPATINSRVKWKENTKLAESRNMSKRKVYWVIRIVEDTFWIFDNSGVFFYFNKNFFTPCDENWHSLPWSDERIREYYDQIDPDYQWVWYKMEYEPKQIWISKEFKEYLKSPKTEWQKIVEEYTDKYVKSKRDERIEKYKIQPLKWNHRKEDIFDKINEIVYILNILLTTTTPWKQ